MKTLGDELPGPVDIGPVLEIDVDYGEGKSGEGADIFDLRKSEHRRFDRIGDQPFDLFGSHAFGFCVDLDERRRRMTRGGEGSGKTSMGSSWRER